MTSSSRKRSRVRKARSFAQLWLPVLIVSVALVRADANPPYSLVQTLVNPDPGDYDVFGSATAFIGDNILVAAPSEDGAGVDAGAVYLFDGVTGALLRTFVDPTPGDFEYFGTSVAAFGSNVLIGSPGDSSSGTTTGAAYLFDGTTGALLHTFLNPTPEANDLFGQSLAVVDGNVLIGAPQDTRVDSEFPAYFGAAYLFDGITGELLHTFLNPTRDLDEFAYSVAGIGSNVLIGAPTDDSSGVDSGAAYLFDGVTGELMFTFFSPAAGDDDRFGGSVAAVGNLAVIGAGWDDTAEFKAGAVYVFDGASGVLVQTLLPPSSVAFHAFGSAVANAGGNILVGSVNYGLAYLYDGDTFSLLTTFTGPSAEWSCYGCTVTSNADGTAVVISESEAVHLYTAAPEDSDGDGILDDADACPAQAPALGLDADANGCTDTIGGLTALVQSVPLTPNIRRGLMAKLDDAGKAIDRGHTAAAVNKVQEFISQVRAQSGKAITTANADLLTSYATNLIALLQT